MYVCVSLELTQAGNDSARLNFYVKSSNRASMLKICYIGADSAYEMPRTAK